MADSTINGLTALTGANVDNTADQLAIWDNSDSTTKKITRTELMVGLPAGTAAAPAISFSGDTDTGVYNIGANILGFTVGGIERLRISSAGRVLVVSNGAASDPSIANSGYTNTGLYWPAINTLGFTSNGAEAMRIDSSQRLLVGGTSSFSIRDGAGASVTAKLAIAAPSGTVAAGVVVQDGINNRSMGLFVDQTNALCGISSNQLAGAVPFVYRDATAERLRITTDGLVQIAAAGTAALPAITIGGDTDTGIYNSGANQLSIAVGANERFRFYSGGALGISASGTAVNPVLINTTHSTTGLWWPASSTLAISTGGTERLRLDSTGNVIVNTAAIAPTATDGFLYVSSCAGTPTGTPTPYSGRVPIVVDTTNNKLYFYSGGAWRDAGP